MIRYRLVCSTGHEFEGWFRNSAAYDAQAAAGQLVCAVCGRAEVEKALMAPSIAQGGNREISRPAGVPAMSATDADGRLNADRVREFARLLRAEVEANAEYVGQDFAEEARRIHYEESENRRIWGEASLEDAAELHDEGIAVLPLPRSPDDMT